MHKRAGEPIALCYLPFSVVVPIVGGSIGVLLAVLVVLVVTIVGGGIGVLIAVLVVKLISSQVLVLRFLRKPSAQ